MITLTHTCKLLGNRVSFEKDVTLGLSQELVTTPRWSGPDLSSWDVDWFTTRMMRIPPMDNSIRRGSYVTMLELAIGWVTLQLVIDRTQSSHVVVSRTIYV